RQKQKKLIMLPSETMIWQPEFTDKTLSRKPGAVQNERATVIQNKIDSIMAYIASSLEMVGKKKIRAGIHQVTIRKPSETVEIIDSSALPPEYVEFETTIKADKLAIKHQLKAGINIPGAQLKVGKPSLLIK
ncbi:siphovirus Gp157 family protein, partial [Escherichia coli]|nr:siphovirus Gp157 family protein [Escherichia coli]